MICPNCNHDLTLVVDSRAAAGDTAVRRRRKCTECLQRFTTYELALNDGEAANFNERREFAFTPQHPGAHLATICGRLHVDDVIALRDLALRLSRYRGAAQAAISESDAARFAALNGIS